MTNKTATLKDKIMTYLELHKPAPYTAIKCHNCKVSIKPVLLNADFEQALCPDCEHDCMAHNQYISSVSKDCAAI